MEKKNVQPRILYPARQSFKSFRIEGEIKSFPENQRRKRFARIIKEDSLSEKKRLKVTDCRGTERLSRHRDKTSDKKTLNSYLSRIMLNVNGLTVPNKRHRVSEPRRNKTHAAARVAQWFSATFGPGHDPGDLGSSPTSGFLHGAC